MTGPRADSDYQVAVLSWVAHLRSGGSLTWGEWRSRTEAQNLPADNGELDELPGAAQLELVRRLAASPPSSGVTSFGALADRLLTTSAPGRGPGELPLDWPAGPAGDPEYGVPPVDPTTLDDEELLRACVGGLAALLAELEPPPVRRPRRHLVLPWRSAFTVHGSPVLAAGLRQALVEHGLVEGGRRAVHLVVAAPFHQMMAEHWIRRTRNGASIPWERMWRQVSTAGRVPSAIAVDALAARLAGQSGARRVRLLVAGSPAEALHLALTALGTGASREKPEHVPGPQLDVVSAELLRRLNRVLRLRVEVPRRRQLAATVLPQVAAHQGAGALAPPQRLQSWAHAAAERMATSVAAAGYPVLGDPGDLVPAPASGVRRTVDLAAALELGLAGCIRTWAMLDDMGTEEA